MCNVKKNDDALQRAGIRSTFVMALCVVFLCFGCSSKSDPQIEEPQKIDVEAFVSVLKLAPFVDVSEEELPKWLNNWIEGVIDDFAGSSDLIVEKSAEVYRGKWKEQTVYHVWSVNSNCPLCIYHENGEPVHWSDVKNNNDLDDFLATSVNWELIFQIVNGKMIEKMDHETFLKMIDSAPFVSVSLEELPDGLRKWIEGNISMYVGTESGLYGTYRISEVYRGKWKGRTVYIRWSVYFDCFYAVTSCVMNENAKFFWSFILDWQNMIDREDFFSTEYKIWYEDFLATSANWELIHKIAVREGVWEIYQPEM